MEDFKEKVQRMTGKELVMAMVKGLRKPTTLIDMSTFGLVRKGVCYGCAATNAIIEIMGYQNESVEFFKKIFCKGFYSEADIYYLFLRGFELAIDNLRGGSIDRYNRLARESGFATLPENVDLPYLGNCYSQEQLDKYEEFANSL